ncbi:PucR family transcriptional regulator [Actinomadura yumaensis]|uniref:PucR family transcriptional regulator n=1 Tax=Actinomadura TaxID=1988 RepID=UPI001582A9AC|nr:PucR family transcriptional regulator [Actinomadura sp. J1-007]
MGMDEADRFLRLLIERGGDPALLESTVHAARGKSDLVAALPEEETRRHTRALLNGVIAALENGGVPGGDALAAAERLGSDRARQGVPVAAFLDGFQAGRAHLVRTLVSEGRRLGVPADALLDGVTRVDEITTALVHRMVHAHRVAELEMARTTREGQLQMLRRLLHGEPAPVLAPLDASGAYHCVVSDVSDPAVAARLETALTASGTGLCGLVDGRLAALVTRLPAVHETPSRSGPPRGVPVGGVSVGGGPAGGPGGGSGGGAGGGLGGGPAVHSAMRPAALAARPAAASTAAPAVVSTVRSAAAPALRPAAALAAPPAAVPAAALAVRPVAGPVARPAVLPVAGPVARPAVVPVAVPAVRSAVRPVARLVACLGLRTG